MPDKTVRFVIDSDVWRRFKIYALEQDLTAAAALANLITDTVRKEPARGVSEADSGSKRRSGGARDAA